MPYEKRPEVEKGIINSISLLLKSDKAVSDLTEHQKSLVSTLSPYHSKLTNPFITKFYEKYPDLLNHRALNESRDSSATHLMKCLTFGNFPQANLLRDLGASGTIGINERSILMYIASSRYITGYTNYAKTRQDELDTFQRIYKMHDWNKEMNSQEKADLLDILKQNNKDHILCFLRSKNFFESLNEFREKEQIAKIFRQLASPKKEGAPAAPEGAMDTKSATEIELEPADPTISAEDAVGSLREKFPDCKFTLLPEGTRRPDEHLRQFADIAVADLRRSMEGYRRKFNEIVDQQDPSSSPADPSTEKQGEKQKER